jgi:hypothetical protein
MSQITVELIRITPFSDLSSIDKLGYNKTIQGAGNYRLPTAGNYEVTARAYDYITADGLILHDWLMIEGMQVGYVLRLPEYVQPCPIDPNAPAIGSKLQRAVDYYIAHPGCSQSEAARSSRCAPSNLNARLKYLINNGKI